jgi:hypothetical protein
MKTIKATLTIMIAPALIMACFMGPLVSKQGTVSRAPALVSVNR